MAFKTGRLTASWVAMTFVFLSSWWYLGGLRVALLARAEGEHISVGVGVRALLVSLFAAAVTPAASGSTLGTVWFLSRFISLRTASAIAVYGLVLDMAFFAWSVPVCLAITRLRGVELGVPGLTWFALLASVLALLGAWALAFRLSALKRLIYPLLRVVGAKRAATAAVRFLHRVGASLARLNRLPARRQVLIHAVTALGFVAHFAIINGLVLALGIEADQVALLAGQNLVSVVAMAVPTPGGSGFYELALHRLLAGTGVSAAALITLVTLSRALTFYLYLVLGPLAGSQALIRRRAGP